MVISRPSIVALAVLLMAQPGAAQVVFEPHSMRVKNNVPDPRNVTLPCSNEVASSPRPTSVDGGHKQTKGTADMAPGDPGQDAAKKRKAALNSDPLEELNREYHQESWSIVQESARYLLGQIQCAAGKDGDARAYDFRTDYIVLNWVGADAFGTYSIHRLLVSNIAPPPFKSDLPGVDRYYEILLSKYEASRVTTVLTSTEVADPVLAQIPDVAARVLPGLFGLIADTAGTVNGRANMPAGLELAAPQKAVISVTPFEVNLPKRRATIGLNSVLTEPISQGDFKREATRVATRAGFQLSTCAHDLAVADQAAAIDAASDSLCAAGKDRPPCLDRFREAFVAKFEDIRKRKDCGTDASAKAMSDVDDAFRTFTASNLEREVKTQLTFSNTPPGHYSFGLVGGVALGAWVHKPRVKLTDEGILKADPMPRILTIVALNRSFRGYDPSTVTATSAEKLRAFIGAVLTPDFGISGGFSWLPVRGFALNGGIALLFPKTLAEGNVIGQEPNNTKDPFGLGTATAVFVGAAYNFK